MTTISHATSVIDATTGAVDSTLSNAEDDLEDVFENVDSDNDLDYAVQDLNETNFVGQISCEEGSIDNGDDRCDLEDME